MLDFIVSSRRQVKNMDVYLQPSMDELKELQEGIYVYYVQNLSHQRGVLGCMAYVHTPHMIIRGQDFAHVSMLFDFFIFKAIFIRIFAMLDYLYHQH